EEVAIWAFCWAIFLGMAIAVGRDNHIAIDTLPNMLSEKNRIRLRFFNRAIIAAASVMFVVHGWIYVSKAIQASPAMQWPMKYYFLAIPMGGLLNLFFLLWPKAGRGWIEGAATVIAGGAIYLLVRFIAPELYGEASSAL